MRCTSFLFILGFTTISAASEVASNLTPRAQAVIAETFGALSQNLMKALREGGVRQVVPFCEENAAGLVKRHLRNQRWFYSLLGHISRQQGRQSSQPCV